MKRKIFILSILCCLATIPAHAESKYAYEDAVKIGEYYRSIATARNYVVTSEIYGCMLGDMDRVSCQCMVDNVFSQFSADDFMTFLTTSSRELIDEHIPYAAKLCVENPSNIPPIFGGGSLSRGTLSSYIFKEYALSCVENGFTWKSCYEFGEQISIKMSAEDTITLINAIDKDRSKINVFEYKTGDKETDKMIEGLKEKLER